MRIAFTPRAATNVGLVMLLCGGALAATTLSARAAEPPRVPEQVAHYFASALIPRLADLYGPGVDGESGIGFDETTRVGSVSRVLTWTDDFRSGRATDHAVELTNTWVAAITIGTEGDDAAESTDDAAVTDVGLATVWISPQTNLPELATFVPSAELGPALARIPEGALLVHDVEQDAWFALLDDELTPLASGAEAATGAAMSLSDAQQTLWQELETLPQPQQNRGFVFAGLTLGFIVVLLAVFVLIPDRRRSAIDPEVALGFSPRNSDAADR